MVQLSQFNILGQQFEQDRLSQESLFKTLRGSVKSLRTQNLAAELATPRISEKDRQSAMIRLATVNKEVFESVSSAMQSGDARVLAKQQAAAEKSTKLAAFYSTFATTEEGQNSLKVQIRKDAHDALANREFERAQKLFDLANMTAGGRKATIVKMQVVGQDVATAVKSAQDIISKREQEELNIARNILALPEVDRLQAITQLEQDAAAKGNTALAAKLNRIRSRPEELTPILQAVINRAEPTAPGKPFSLTPGQKRFGPGGELIAEVEAAPNKPLSKAGKEAFDIKNGWITKAESKSGDFEVARLNPNDFTPESWKIATSPGGSSQDLRPSELAKQKADRGEFATGGAFIIRNPDGITNSLVVPVTNKRTGKTVQNVSQLGGPLVERAGGQLPQEISELKAKTAGAVTFAERMALIDTQADLTGVQKRTERDFVRIDSAVEIAEQIPTIRRNLELLQRIKTGGIDAIVLATAQTLGIETADQAELQFNLMKNVLKQLKPTFGAQFTEKEGRLLIDIEASKKKSTAGNIVIMERILEQFERKVELGRRSAKRQGDEAALDEIELLLESLAPLKPLRGQKEQPRAEKTFNPETGLLE